MPSVLIASERLLAELETVWREDVMLRGLPEVLLNYAQRSSSVYIAYCSNQVSIDTTLKELRYILDIAISATTLFPVDK